MKAESEITSEIQAIIRQVTPGVCLQGSQGSPRHDVCEGAR